MERLNRLEESRNEYLRVLGELAVNDEIEIGFYDNSLETATESERLIAMSEFADPISLEIICETLGADLKERVVLDLGAGDSTSLGSKIESMGAKYLPVDSRQESVQKQRLAGFEATQSNATALDIPDNKVDLLHSRFTFGWLNDEERKMALRESIRVLKNKGSIIVSDYDWSAIEGPEPLMAAAKEAVKLLQNFGFNTVYGREISEDLRILTGDIKHDSGAEILFQPEKRESIYEGTIVGGLAILELTAESICDFLDQTGDYSIIDSLREKVSELKEYVINNPDETVKLADVVTQIIDVKKSSSNSKKQAEATEEISKDPESEYIEGVDYQRIFSESVKGLEHTFLAKSTRLINEARRVQAESYVSLGLIEPESVKDKMLSEEIDPSEQVKRSEYVVTTNSDLTKVISCTRIIKPDLNIGIESLPTVKGKAYKFLQHEFISKHPENIVEISALAKKPNEGRHDDTIKSLLGLIVHINRQGFDGAVMELRSDKTNLFLSLFGEENFIVSKEDGLAHAIELTGVSSSIKYTDILVDSEGFCQNAYQYAINKIEQARSLGKKTPIFPELIRLAFENEI